MIESTTQEIKIKKEYKKKPDFKTKAGKLFKAQQSGLNDNESAKVAGINPKNITELERTKTYKACERSFKESLLEQITVKEITSELIKNIKQDTDKGAKNNAIKIAQDKIEPDDTPQQAQQVNIVLR